MPHPDNYRLDDAPLVNLRRKTIDAEATRCGRALSRAESELARLEDSDDGNTVLHLATLSAAVEQALEAISCEARPPRRTMCKGGLWPIVDTSSCPVCGAAPDSDCRRARA